MTLPLSDELRAAKSSSEWLAYFQHNAESWDDVPWEQGVELSAVEREAVVASIQRFQLGESGEGAYLLEVAKEYAERSSDSEYLNALRLFIREEQRHAGELGRFLKRAGVPLIRTTWSDTVFRWLRRQAGLELSVVVLVTAEIIAKVYYAALRDATQSSILRAICRQVLREEVEHVYFQTERVAVLRAGRGRFSLAAIEALYRTFFAVTCLVVWFDHRSVFRAAGWKFLDYWRGTQDEVRAAVRCMDPQIHRLRLRVGGTDVGGTECSGTQDS